MKIPCAVRAHARQIAGKYVQFVIGEEVGDTNDQNKNMDDARNRVPRIKDRRSEENLFERDGLPELLAFKGRKSPSL